MGLVEVRVSWPGHPWLSKKIDEWLVFMSFMPTFSGPGLKSYESSGWQS